MFKYTPMIIVTKLTDLNNIQGKRKCYLPAVLEEETVGDCLTSVEVWTGLFRKIAYA